MTDIEDPLTLLGRLRLGREEFCQRLLTQLILDSSYPRWNSETSPSADGLRFLALLEELSFGSAGPWDRPLFIDELDLPKRHDAEKGGAPDHALKDAERLWLIELKTEAGSHRANQIPLYFELGRHHYASHRLDITYLTGPLTKPAPAVPYGSRYAHVTWADILPLVETVWGGRDGVHGEVAGMLSSVVGDLDTLWGQWREARLGAIQAPPVWADPVEVVLELARATAADHGQRASDYLAASLDELQELRLDVRAAIQSSGDPALLHVRPWLWQTSSAGQPMTASGREVGYELRLSWYLKPLAA